MVPLKSDFHNNCLYVVVQDFLFSCITCVGLLMMALQVLIFSQMTHMMDILEDYLELRNLLYSRLDGTMSFSVRQEQVRAKVDVCNIIV